MHRQSLFSVNDWSTSRTAVVIVVVVDVVVVVVIVVVDVVVVVRPSVLIVNE